MITRYILLRPDAAPEGGQINWPRFPGLERVRALVPTIDFRDYHQSLVLADMRGGDNFVPTDLFFDNQGVAKNLPRNEEATAIYRRGFMLRMPNRDPEKLSAVFGLALLFSRRVWF